VNDVNVAVGLFYEKLYDMFRQFVPLNRANSLHYPVWYTSDIIRKLGSLRFLKDTKKLSHALH
jgi:hypothetical protein